MSERRLQVLEEMQTLLDEMKARLTKVRELSKQAPQTKKTAGCCGRGRYADLMDGLQARIEQLTEIVKAEIDERK
jgi:hypothetical protein